MKPDVTDTTAADSASLYDEDFFAWSRATAALLRSRRFAEVDLEHAAEEIEDLGKRDLKELNSRTRVLLVHLLKWTLQRDRRSRSWRATIVTQRQEIEALLRQSPSLRPRIASELAANYAGAVKRAAADAGLAAERFPRQCAFTVEQLLDEDFLPP